MARPIGQYPRWRGGEPLRSGPVVPVIALQEIRKALRDNTFLVGGAVAAFLVVLPVLNLGSATGHTSGDFLQAVEMSLWAAVAISAAVAGPSIVDDRSAGALELYLTRGIRKTDYLLGKILASFGLSFATVAAAGFAYFGAALMLFEEHPEGWWWMPAGILITSFIWALLVSGVGLAVATFSASSRVALLSYVGFFVVLGLFVPFLLEWVTDNPEVWILSPADAMLSQSDWVFRFDSGQIGFPSWWGLIHLVAVIVLSWALFMARRPRARGEVNA